MRFLFLVTAILATVSVFFSIQYFTSTPILPDTENVSTTPPEVPLPLGRHFMIGHWAHTPVASTTALLEKYQLGGVIIMSAPSDAREIQNWTTTWKAAVPYPLHIAIDQEGGPVTRLRGPEFDTTGQRAITTTRDAYAIGKKRGEELAALGITMNFAPVLDTATNPDSFLYTRVFSTSTVALARAQSDGMTDAGVTAVLKHFPGHPDSPEDSHHVLPVVPISKTEQAYFIEPFRTYLQTGSTGAIMTAHVIYPNIDPLPATLSSYWLQDVLRTELQFSGLIITDDMSMKAIADTWSPAEASRLALTAGADIILLAAVPESIISIMDTLKQNVDGTLYITQ